MAKTMSGVFTSHMKEASAHGLPNIARSKSIRVKLVWTIIFLAGFGLLTWQVLERVGRFISNEYGVRLEVKFDKEISFPAVTICNANPVRFSQIREYASEFSEFFTAEFQQQATDEVMDNPLEQQLPAATGRPQSGGEGLGIVRRDVTTKASIPDEFTTERIQSWEDRAEVPDFFMEQDPTFLLRELLSTEIFNFKREDRIHLGHQLETMLLKCEWQGYPCAPSNFSITLSSTFGNCFTFGRRNTSELRASHPGPFNGLSLELFIEHDEYLRNFTDTVGAVVVVHEADKMPLPEDEGILISTGFNTAIGIKKLEISRLGEPYFPCSHIGERGLRNEGVDYYVDNFNVTYSLKTCERSCFQTSVMSQCNCTEPSSPGPLNTTHPPCKTDEEKACRAVIFSKYKQGNVKCNCVNRCVEQVYIPSIRMGQWPSDVSRASVLSEIMRTNAEAREYLIHEIDQHDWLERNVAKVQIFFEEFNYEQIKQYPSYTYGDFISDVGGQLGLWLGISIISLFEIVEMIAAAVTIPWGSMRTAGVNERTTAPIETMKPPIS